MPAVQVFVCVQQLSITHGTPYHTFSSSTPLPSCFITMPAFTNLSIYPFLTAIFSISILLARLMACLLYTSDAADD